MSDAASEESRSSEYLSVSTSKRKCMPPAKSRPKLIGLAPRFCNHSGVDGSDVRAIIKSPPE